MFYYMEPEVAGSLGPDTILDRSTHPPIVKRLDFLVADWLGDELLETFPCFVVTIKLQQGIEDSYLTGVNFTRINVNYSTDVIAPDYDQARPLFSWMKVHGVAGVDDFGLGEDFRLVVSGRAKKLLETYSLNYADFEAYK